MQLRSHQPRTIAAMQSACKGIVVQPTGAGKTLEQIMHLQGRLSASERGLTAVIVAPRLLLCNQLSDEYLQIIDTNNVHILHVHSGETHHF